MHNLRSLTMYPGYSNFEFGLFQNQDCLLQETISTKQTAADFLPMLTTALQKTDLSLDNLDYCTVFTGPGSFTTLRISVAFANGFAFAKNIPLVAVTGFESLVQLCTTDISVISYRALSNEIYLSIRTKEQTILLETCVQTKNIPLLMQTIPMQATITFIGNGTPLIIEQLGNEYIRNNPRIIISPIQEPTLQQVTAYGEQQFLQQPTTSYVVQPLYSQSPTPPPQKQ